MLEYSVPSHFSFYHQTKNTLFSFYSAAGACSNGRQIDILLHGPMEYNRHDHVPLVRGGHHTSVSKRHARQRENYACDCPVSVLLPVVEHLYDLQNDWAQSAEYFRNGTLSISQPIEIR